MQTQSTENRWFETVAVLLAAAAGDDRECVRRTGRAPGHELCADDAILHGNSAGNGNVHRVTSLIEVNPDTKERVPVLRLVPGATVDLGGEHIPAVYQRTCTRGPEQATHGIGLGLPDDPAEVGVIFHHGGLSLTEAACKAELAEMVEGGMIRRGVTRYQLEMVVATSLPDPEYPDLWRGAGACLLFLNPRHWGRFGDAAVPLP